MEIRKDKNTGIIRHTYGTVSPRLCRKEICDSGIVKNCFANGKQISFDEALSANEVMYDVELGRTKMNIISTMTRTIIIGGVEKPMLNLYDKINGKVWEYDDLGKPTDFVAR